MRMRIKAPTAEYNNNGVFCAHRPGGLHARRCSALSGAVFMVRRCGALPGSAVMAELTVAACMPPAGGHKDTKKRIYAVLCRQMEF